MLNTYIEVQQSTPNILTLTELEATTSLRTSRLLTFYLAGITCHEALGTQGLLVLGINLDQRTCDGKTQSLALTCETATLQINLDIVFLCTVQSCQWLLYDILQNRAWEIFGKITLVDSNLAATLLNIYTGNCALAAAQSIYYCHNISYL